MSEWIRVENRLPDSTREVLVVHEVKLLDGAYKLLRDCDHYGLEEPGWYFAGDSVTHWMEWPRLPQPPKENSDG